MGARIVDSDDAYEEESPEEEGPDSDEDYSAGDEEDSDASRKRGKKRGRSKPAPKARTTRSRGRSSVSYKDESSEEEDDEEEEEEEDDEESYEDSDSDGGYSGRKTRGAAASSRPTRAAAAQTNKKLKRQVSGGGSEEDEEEDEELARQLNQELNGLRARAPRKAVSAPVSPAAAAPKRSALRSTIVPGRGGGGSSSSRQAGGGDSRGSKARAPKRHSQRSATRGVSYVEDDGDSEDGGGRGGSGKRLREPIAAFDGPGDDEVERILGHREAADVAPDPSDPWSTREFLIKWMRHSYTHCSWDRRSTLEQLAGYKRVLNYIRKVDNEAADAARGVYSREELELRDVERAMEEQLVQQHSQIERILADGEDDEGLSQYLVKWEGLPYSECTWEREDEVLAAAGGPEQMGLWSARVERLSSAPHRSVDAQRKQFKLKSTRALEKQPDFLAGAGVLKLRDYQLDGLNWMVYSWSQDRNVILADEMGLGKTVQCVAFLGYLSEIQQMRGPFLVVVPLSTVPNWVREFRRWTPQVNTVVYVGDSRSREVIRKFEFESNHAREQGRKQFEVLITTYELILKDASTLGKIRWNYLVVDEAHRLKNAESALYIELASWHFRNKLLVTGTPLQNNLRELWALLHFLEPEKFPDGDAFESEYELQTMDGVSALHAMLRPHLLRRVIKEVEKSLPPKNERILRVEMSPLQKQYYKWILSRNFRELNKGLKGGGQVSLLNIIGELKKVCNHPFLFESAEESFRGSDADRGAAERLVVAAGKMVLLDKLLRRLKETGHRVLIFSQMVRVLDIISDYCRLRGWMHQRLDGSTPAAARHAAMEHFNAPDSADFAFLLSTRAGGLGINLATADTVIIFDSDWNPQNDLQAMSRAHRIGQTETVNIYRFVTSNSVEEDILERAKRKMVLDHLVIQRMDTSGRTVLDPQEAKNSAKAMFGKDELAAILRFGAEDLFKNQAVPALAPGAPGSAEVAKQTHEAATAMYEEDIDAILERAEVVDNNKSQQEEAPAEGADGGLLSSFNVATFKNEEDDAAFWSRLIPVAERAPDEENMEELGPRAARLKAEEALMDADERARRAAQRSQPGVRRGPPGSDPGPPVEGAALRIEEWRLDVGDDGIPLAIAEGDTDAPIITRSLCRKDAHAFVRAVRRYGMQSRVDEACREVGKGMDDLTRPQRLALWLVLMDACRRCVSITEADHQDAKDAILDFFGAAVRSQELLAHCTHMRYLARRVAALAAPPITSTHGSHGPHAGGDARGGSGGGAGLPAVPAAAKAAVAAGVPAVALTAEVVNKFRLEPGATLPVPKWGKLIGWTPVDDAMLLMGVLLHGIGHWDKIAADPLLHLSDKLACVVNPPAHAPAPAGTSGAAGGEGEAGAGDGGEENEKAGGKVTLPKASHMETRVLGLLKKLYLSSKANPKPGPGPRQRPNGPGATRPPPVRVPKPPKQPLAKGGSPDNLPTQPGGGASQPMSTLPGGGDRGPPPGWAGRGPGDASTSGRDGERNGAGGSGSGRPPGVSPPGKRKVPGAGGAKGGAAHGSSGSQRPDSRSEPSSKQPRPDANAGGGGKGGKDKRGGGPPPGGGAGADVQELLSAVAPQIKAWRHLGEDTTLDNKEVVKRMMGCLQAIGVHIEEVVSQQGSGSSKGPAAGDLRARLWKQISRATKNERDGEQLQTLYQKIAARQAQQAAGGPQGLGGGAGTGAAPNSSTAGRGGQAAPVSKPR